MTFLFYLPFLLIFVVLGIWGERKIAALIQNRMGPMEVGPIGLLQSIADLLKMLQKENIIPQQSQNIYFRIAPIIIFLSVFIGFSFLPLTPTLSGSSIYSGLFLLLVIISLDVVGIFMASWSSNNKYSLLGGMRAVAQIISYEVPLGLSVLCVVIVSQTLDLQEISYLQGILSQETTYFLGVKSWDIKVNELGGFLAWNIFQNPFLFFVFIVFFISGLAESNRNPFDLSESESEIIGGYHTEYSGFVWGIVMLAEYGMMLLLSLLSVILFFGSWNTPFINFENLPLAEMTTGEVWSIFWLVFKTIVLIFIQMWIRWTVPRFRIDQMMSLCWKYLCPIVLILLFLCVGWKINFS